LGAWTLEVLPLGAVASWAKGGDGARGRGKVHRGSGITLGPEHWHAAQGGSHMA
jgi:hypothetical protein